jgi:hypothetical protein
MTFLKRLFVRAKARRILSRNFDAKAFKQRLAALPADDPLWSQLLELLDAHLLIESGAISAPNLDAGEAHRGCGRIAMLHDLRGDLERTWRESREQPVEQKPPSI